MKQNPGRSSSALHSHTALVGSVVTFAPSWAVVSQLGHTPGCAVRGGSHQPHVVAKHLKYGWCHQGTESQIYFISVKLENQTL